MKNCVIKNSFPWNLCWTDCSRLVLKRVESKPHSKARIEHNVNLKKKKLKILFSSHIKNAKSGYKSCFVHKVLVFKYKILYDWRPRKSIQSLKIPSKNGFFLLLLNQVPVFKVRLDAQEAIFAGYHLRILPG